MASEQGMEDRHGLQTGLRRRHVTMIALGGVIGAGLAVGSGAVIKQTGPAAVLSYLMAAILVVFVIRTARVLTTGTTLVVLGDRARGTRFLGHRDSSGRNDPSC